MLLLLLLLLLMSLLLPLMLLLRSPLTLLSDTSAVDNDTAGTTDTLLVSPKVTKSANTFPHKPDPHPRSRIRH